MRKNFLNKFLINNELELENNNRFKDLSVIKKYHSKLLINLTEYLFRYAPENLIPPKDPLHEWSPVSDDI